MGKNRQHPKGFSMVELVFAIAVIATALILFIGVFFSMFRATEKGVDLTAGTVVAESQLMKYLAAMQNSSGGLDNLASDGTVKNAGDGASMVAGSGTVPSLNRTIFTYEIKSWAVDEANAPNLRRVEITVWWWGANEQNPGRIAGAGQVGYGRLSVVLSRLVFTKSKVVLND